MDGVHQNPGGDAVRCLTTILGAESLGSKMMSKKQVERGCGYMLLLGFASRQVKKAGRSGRSEDQNRRWCGGDRERKSFGLGGDESSRYHPVPKVGQP